MSPAALMPAVVALCRQAGAAILDIYRRDDFDVTRKGDDSPLTAADLAAHQVLVQGLQALTPELPVLSEESASVPWRERQQWQRYWLVDPLDGTKEFIKRNGEFTVNVALIDDGVPVLGVVHVPVLDWTYYGDRDSGAVVEKHGSTTRIHVSRLPVPTQVLRVVASRNHRGDELDGWLARVQQTHPQVELVSMGSSLKICLVAEGSADIYPRLAPTCEWDTAAAQAVLEAAGGKLVDVRGAVYRYNRKEDLLNPWFFAVGDGERAQALIALVQA
ncbi:MAG TPA: 3'(2'),5'-bisphosphate nucleotidase CysQ [Candidatus Acidoferrum sp.]|nr:3'(2'),5'-bisphosphate nucleotidase CysQ [Candidatus Acidoferrum sp.]